MQEARFSPLIPCLRRKVFCFVKTREDYHMVRTQLPCRRNMRLEKTENEETLNINTCKILHLQLTRRVFNKLAENWSNSCSNAVILSSYCKAITDHHLITNYGNLRTQTVISVTVIPRTISQYCKSTASMENLCV